MADRSAAEIFGFIFEHLAKYPNQDNRLFALKLWEKKNEYDFSIYQMYEDETKDIAILIPLGLAKKGINQKYPGEGEVVLYFGRDY